MSLTPRFEAPEVMEEGPLRACEGPASGAVSVSVL